MNRDNFIQECLDAFNREFGLGILCDSSNASVERICNSLKFLRFKTQDSALVLCEEFRPVAEQVRAKWALRENVPTTTSPVKPSRRVYSTTHPSRCAPGESTVLLEKLRAFLFHKTQVILEPRRFSKTRSEPIRSSSPNDYDGIDTPDIKDRTIFKAQSRHASVKQTLKSVPENEPPVHPLDCEPAKRKHVANPRPPKDTAEAAADADDVASNATLANESRMGDYNKLRSQKQSENLQKPQATTISPGSTSPMKRRKTQNMCATFGPDSGFYGTTTQAKDAGNGRLSTQYKDPWEDLIAQQKQADEEWEKQMTEQDEQEFLQATTGLEDTVVYPDLADRDDLEDPVLSETGNFTSFSHEEPQVTEWDEYDDPEATSHYEFSEFSTSGPETPKSGRMRAIRSAPTTPMHQPQFYASGRPRISTSAEPFPASQRISFETLDERLEQVFPQLPLYLSRADFTIRWEVMRAALHCEVDLSRISMDVSQITSQQDLIEALRKDPLFKGKKLPPQSHNLAFEAARTTGRARGQAVVFGAKLSISEKCKGPLFYLSLEPLHLERGNRLIRRFGADRFLDLSFPYLRNKKAPRIVQDTVQGVDKVMEWLVASRHSFLDRSWSAFFTHDKKENRKAKVADSEWFTQSTPQAESVNRVVLFAENGIDFMSPSGPGNIVPPKDYAMRADMRQYMDRETLINWAVEPWHPENQEQPALKLFSRLALSLSSTFATVILKPDQIIHDPGDILSPTHAVMNDGIGTMSKRLAARIAEILGLDHPPCGYQGRIGSAKGLWVVGTEKPDELWIKTYKSQRKWKCSGEDDDHRTFEVLSEVRPLRPSGLNTQFIPVIMAQSIDQEKMKKVISEYLRTTMEEEMLVHKAMSTDNPKLYLQWLHENPSARFERIAKGTVEFRGGLPRSRYEATKLLLVGGFHPLKQKFLFDLVESLVKERSNQLKDRFKISIPQSTYAYMVADFSGVLEEGEVHMGFSQSFRIHAQESVTLLHGQDALVARSPAHFPSDIQRVKLVFHPSLRHLEDVIVFSTKGDRPLADLLSGGDYDGDKAWVCWDPDIVENFDNAKPPPKLDMGLEKEDTTFADLAKRVDADEIDSITLFLGHAFSFNMHESMLGICTRYKEDLCYNFNSVSCPEILTLSTLLGLLVDQAKQGYIFTSCEWDEFRSRLGLKSRISQPQYRGDTFTPPRQGTHILDHLKFNVAIPTISNALKLLESRKKEVQYYDPVLLKPCRQLEAWCQSPNSIEKEAWKGLRNQLTTDIRKLLDSWSMSGSTKAMSYAERIEEHAAMLAKIRPVEASLAAVPLIKDLLRLDQPDMLSPWGRLKASKVMSLREKSDVAFWLAGAQLQSIKAMEAEATNGGAIVYMTSDMYAVHQPDRRVIMGLLAQDTAAGYADTVAASQDDSYSQGVGDDDLWGLLE